MFVKDRMTTDVSTVSPSDAISKAFQILYDKKHSQLPVVHENGVLAGLLTEKMLKEVSPSKATSLSVYEINYLLQKTKVSDVMETKVFTISPDDLIEQAALIMKNNDIGSLPVVSADEKLVGIVTRLDIFSAFIEIMGVNDRGTRIALETKNEVGTMADISGIIEDYGVNITHVSNYDTGDRVELTICLNTTDCDNIIEAFEKNGYKIHSVVKND